MQVAVQLGFQPGQRAGGRIHSKLQFQHEQHVESIWG